jgi:hypothetical protein
VLLEVHIMKVCRAERLPRFFTEVAAQNAGPPRTADTGAQVTAVEIELVHKVWPEDER